MAKRRRARGTGRAGAQKLRAAVLAAVLAVTVSACGGGADGEGRAAPAGTDSLIAGSASPAATPAPGADASAAPTARPSRGPAAGAAVDLEAVALKPGDLAEFRMVDVPPIRTEPVRDVSPAACRTVAEVRREAYDPAPSALVRRYAVATRGEHLGTGTQVSLAASTEDGARAVLAALRDAVRACAGGYTGDGRGTTAVTSGTPLDVGDESVSFHTSGRGTPTAYVLVRQGSVLLRFAASSATGGEPRMPVPVVVQQVMKLRAATD
ncbi:hypothetical protein [Streptomyces fradiae]|uniref:hypothetical protein n=1 Tax=Streptomyces fradiae TaxID=1906 RepID=UPI0036AC50AD